MKVYLDNVSTTSVDREVLETYQKLLGQYYCNSDALYDDGVAIYHMQEESRARIASLLQADKDDIIFTSGASEANSLAIKGLTLKHPEKRHLITSSYEHSSVRNAFKQLEETFGYEVTYIEPRNGIIDPKDVEKAIRKDTLLVSIMCVNNEIGALNDIAAIGKTVKSHPFTYFHSDITQALGKIDLDLSRVDMASFSAHKIHGLKGSGALLRRKHIDLLPVISGGQQEYGIRGGTSNALVNIVLAKTIRIALKKHEENRDLMKHYRDILENGLSKIQGVSVNRPENYIESLLSVTTPIPSEVLLNALNKQGIMVSSKSTCGSRKNEPNPSLRSIGADEDHSIRVSYDYTNTEEELTYFLETLKEIIDKYGRTQI